MENFAWFFGLRITPSPRVAAPGQRRLAYAACASRLRNEISAFAPKSIWLRPTGNYSNVRLNCAIRGTEREQKPAPRMTPHIFDLPVHGLLASVVVLARACTYEMKFPTAVWIAGSRSLFRFQAGSAEWLS